MKNKTKILACVGILAALALVIVLALLNSRVTITDITLPPTATILKGETEALTPEFGTEKEAPPDKLASAAAKLTLTWESSDEDVATVDETGQVTAVGAGTADITVTTTAGQNTLNASTTVTVEVLLEEVTADPELALTTNGDNTSANVNAALVPADASGVKLVFESSDESVATVDENGLVTAVGNGECTITASAVGDTPHTDETVIGEADTDGDGEPETDIKVPDDLDPNFAVVPDAWKAETKVTVTTLAESVDLDETEGILYVGNTHTIEASVSPTETTLAKLTWVSSDESVATVDENGKVTANKVGTATITVTTEDGNAKATYEVTVQEKPKPAATTTTNKKTGGSTGTTSGGSSGGGGNTGSGGTPSQTPSNPEPVPSNPEPAPAPAPDPAPSDPDPTPPQDDGNWSKVEEGNETLPTNPELGIGATRS